MGIALEKQKRDGKPVNTDEYKSMFGLLLRHKLLDKRFVNTRPIGHEVGQQMKELFLEQGLPRIHIQSQANIEGGQP